MISDNINTIKKRIKLACERVGRNPSEVTLIAVSKTKPVSMMKDVYESGIKDFGENRVQELVEKYEELDGSWGEDIKWHQIGHLQRNKVKYIIDKATLIHSVDSIRLAKQINKEASKKNIISDVLIQINIANEDSKYGIDKSDLEEFLQELIKLTHIRVRGLMALAPYVDDPEKNRNHFKEMHQLFVDIESKNHDNCINEDGISSFDTLSMGMTGDFEVAIEEGATMVRVGTGVFGERQ